MSRRNKLWTRERITAALTRYVAEYGVEGIPNYVLRQREAGRGLPNSERPYPSDLTVRVEFPAMADAWRAAGVDVPVKHRAPKKPKPRSTAFVSAVSPLEAVNARLDAATPRNAKLRSAPLAAVPADPSDELRQARADRDLLAEIVAGLLRGDVPPEQVEAMRIGVMVGRAAKS